MGKPHFRLTSDSNARFFQSNQSASNMTQSALPFKREPEKNAKPGFAVIPWEKYQHLIHNQMDPGEAEIGFPHEVVAAKKINPHVKERA
jgi:hypothetical protein